MAQNLKKEMGDFALNLVNWDMNGSLFLEILVFVWVYFQMPWWHVPTKTKLEYPPTIVYISDKCKVASSL